MRWQRWTVVAEQIASERIGRETVTYVSNIYKYYVAYTLLSEERDRRRAPADLLDLGRRRDGAKAGRPHQSSPRGETMRPTS